MHNALLRTSGVWTLVLHEQAACQLTHHACAVSTACHTTQPPLRPRASSCEPALCLKQVVARRCTLHDCLRSNLCDRCATKCFEVVHTRRPKFDPASATSCQDPRRVTALHVLHHACCRSGDTHGAAGTMSSVFQKDVATPQDVFKIPNSRAGILKRLPTAHRLDDESTLQQNLCDHLSQALLLHARNCARLSREDVDKSQVKSVVAIFPAYQCYSLTSHFWSRAICCHRILAHQTP